ADADLGFLVVERDDRRRGDDVGLAVAAQRGQQRGPAAPRIRNLADADRDALCDGGGVRRIARGRSGERDDAAREVGEADRVVAVAARDPGGTELGGLLLADLDDDRVDLYLESRNVDLIDDGEHVLANALGGID